MVAVQATKTETKEPLTETQREVARIKAEAQRAVAQVKAKGVVVDLIKAVKAGKTGAELYPFAKQFCNYEERQRALEKKAQEESKPTS